MSSYMSFSIRDLAIEVSERIDDPSNSGYDRFVGLEHYKSGQIRIDNWGSPSKLESSTKVFKTGDCLVARRNVYLKRASIVDFEGLTSGDSIVLRPIDQRSARILPFILNSKRFWIYAEKNADGSMSKRLSPKTLLDYSFNVSNDVNEKTDYLWSIVDTYQAYQNLLSKIDGIIYARFEEMFGDSTRFPQEPLNLNVHEMFIGPFGSALKNDCFVEPSEGYCMVYEQKHAIQKTMDLPTRYVNESKYNELKRFSVLPGDIIVSCRGTIGEIYKVPDNAPMGIMHPSIMKIRLNLDRYNPKFFILALEKYMKEHNNEAKGSGVKMAVTATTLGKELFVVPPMNIQRQFATFVDQVEMTKKNLMKTMEQLDRLKMDLIYECFENEDDEK